MKLFNRQVAKIIVILFVGLFFEVAANAQSVVTYFHNDVSGSPMVATDAAGNVVWKEGYRPYGEKVRNEANNTYGTNKLSFAGKPYDASTGLSYMGARYYDPVIGRFMGVDPVGFQEANVHSFNRYTYANNNPYKFVDPDGRSALVTTGVGVLVIGGTYYALAPPSKQREMRESVGRLVRAIGNVLHSESAGSGDGAKGEPAKGGANTAPPEVADKIPSEWGDGVPNRKGDGTRWQDPNDKGSGVRVDAGDPNNSQPSQQVDHVIVRDKGVVIGRDGRPINGSIKQDPTNAHIPLSEYKNWSSWNKP